MENSQKITFPPGIPTSDLGGAAVEFVRVEPGETPWNPDHPHAMDLSNWYNQYKIKGVPSSLPMMIRYPAIRQGIEPKISHTMLILKGLVICCCSLNENCHESCPPNRIEIYRKIRIGTSTSLTSSSRLPLLHPQHRHIRLLLAQPPELENKPNILGCGLQPIDGNIGYSSFLGLPRCMSVSVSSVPKKHDGSTKDQRCHPTHQLTDQPSLTIPHHHGAFSVVFRRQ